MRVLRVGSIATVGLAVSAAAAAVAVGQAGPDKAAGLKAAVDVSKPKNIILFIGDGMGDSEVTSGRYYAKGAAGRLNMDALPFRGDVTTYNVGPAAAPPYPPNYVPDSAPTAAAWSSGIKTLDGRLGQGPSSGVTVPGTNYETYMEIAKQRGLSTGNVSTAEITDATPAGPSAHISQRGCQGPNDTRSACPTETKAAGGLGSIAEQQADNQFDVVLGGGRARYAQPLDGRWHQERHRLRGPGQGLHSTSRPRPSSARVTALAPGPASARPVPRLEHDDRVPAADRVRHRRRLGHHEVPAVQPRQRAHPGRDDRQGHQRCCRATTKGFVLQVEGASIDKRDHASDACGQIGELIGMDDAIGVAQEFQRTHPDTLIVVSADHSHTSQIIGPTTVPRGQYTTLQTVDGAPIRIAYGTGPIAGSQSHTGATVPVFASRPARRRRHGHDRPDRAVPDPHQHADRRRPRPPRTPVGGDVGGAVPATLALNVGGPAAFPAFTPGVARDYTAALTANVISTAGVATLSVADAGTNAPGPPRQRRVLPRRSPSRPARRTARSRPSAPAPLDLLTYTGPVSNDAVPIEFKQSIAANEALRTGTYGKTLTLTLSTTTP